MTNTSQQYDQITATCKAIFIKKTQDYGTAWRILRPSSLTDQIFIKAQRIRNIEESGEQKVSDSIEDEYKGIINYCLMALIQLRLPQKYSLDLPVTEAENLYDDFLSQTKNLMLQKNHDYGEVWRLMRVSSMTDLILMKLLRTKQIEDNKGKTLISEGVDANYQDMINYAVFALILMDEKIPR
jgi:Nucleotide modification associated domain 1